MTTSDGLSKTRQVRHHLDCLNRRREFLEGRIDAKPEADLSYDRAELASLNWAIPILEVEWDNVARIQREIREAEAR